MEQSPGQSLLQMMRSASLSEVKPEIEDVENGSESGPPTKRQRTTAPSNNSGNAKAPPAKASPAKASPAKAKASPAKAKAPPAKAPPNTAEKMEEALEDANAEVRQVLSGEAAMSPQERPRVEAVAAASAEAAAKAAADASESALAECDKGGRIVNGQANRRTAGLDTSTRSHRLPKLTPPVRSAPRR